MHKTNFSPIIISYRNESHGGGAYYDHYTIRKATRADTIIAHSGQMEILAFDQSIKFSLPTPTSYSDFTQISDKSGLLVIPGRSREIETKRSVDHRIRSEFEQNLIKNALLRGQPILAMCAGSWQLWQAMGGSIVTVEDHNYGAGMPRISQTHGNIGYNKQIHRIRITEDNLLKNIMRVSSSDRPSVNSVHWMAPYGPSKPARVIISAITVQDDDIAPNSRQSRKMKPTADSVEAFENEFGAPVMGIQWHPEAYNESDKADLESQKHLGIIKFMAAAGTTYFNKRRVLKELEEKFAEDKIACASAAADIKGEDMSSRPKG